TVGRLGREHDGHQQLEDAAVFQFGPGMGVGFAQAAEAFFDGGAFHERRARARARAWAMRSCLSWGAGAARTGLLASVRAAGPAVSSCRACSRALRAR